MAGAFDQFDPSTITAEDLMKNISSQQGGGSGEPASQPKIVTPHGAGSFQSITAEDLMKNLQGQKDEAAEAAANQPPAPGKPAVINPNKPSPADETDYGKMGWGEVFARGAQAFPGSVGKTFQNLATAVTHPSETLGGLAELGKGMISAGAGYFVDQPDKVQKAKDEAVFNAFRDEYAKRYGDLFSGAAGLKETIATDPASFGMDVASFAPIVGAGGKLAGLGKAAQVAEKGISLLDPSQLALTAGSKVVDIGGGLAKAGLGGTSGTTKAALDLIENTARNGDLGAQQAFMKGAWGDESLNNTLPAMMEQGADELGKSISDEFARRKTGLTTKALDPSEIEASIATARNEIGAYRNRKGEWVSDDFPNEAATLNEMERRLYNRRDFSAAGLHNMKVGFSDLMDELGRSRMKGAIGKVPEAVRTTINNADEQYGKMMDLWQEWRKQAKDLAAEFGRDRHISTAAKMAKLVKSIQKNKNQHLFDLLRQTQSGKYLPEMIAGATVREWLPDWANKIQNLALTGMAGTALGFGVPHVMFGAAGMSPKIAGHLAYGYGMGRRAGDIVGQVAKAPVTIPISELGGMMEPAPVVGTEPRPPEGSYFKGGRIARKSGGRIMSAGSAAEKLIAAAEKAKKGHSDTTSPLLDVPDEAITKALAIANEKI